VQDEENEMEASRPPIKRITPEARKSVRISRPEPVVVEPLLAGSPMPLLVHATMKDANPCQWATENRQRIEDGLLQRGGILFRGFRVDGLADFQKFIETASGGLLKYTYRSTPRTELSHNIYTSTEYPASQEIPLHNENSYSRSWPMKLFFFCEKNAEEGGMTPIADSHQVFERIPAAIRESFMEKKVMYVRNYGGGADLPWQEVFQTQDQREVERFCDTAGIDYEWLDNGRLRTRQVCQSVARHPRTGRMVWFNQAHLFHVSSLDPKLSAAMLEVFKEEDLPRHSFYGDGTSIETSVLDEIREIYRQTQVAFPWQEGDILMLDNMAVAHGRTPYRGERKIRVGMTEPVDSRDIEQ
jgi:alpha-ketoglutarate-dependent taurine dioxygenase